MSNQYLIDYENVHEAGLYGIKALTAEDSVYIFHTSDTDRIALSTLDDVAAWVKVIPVLPGKQSLDMHLGSFLGYLIGKEECPETQYIIVSKDGDYKGIADFWNRSYQLFDKVTRAQSIWDSMDSPCSLADSSFAADYVFAEKTAIREFIFRTFSKYGVIGLNGLPYMLLSELCTRLNSLAEYNAARKRSGKRPMQFLREEFQDILQITKQWSQDWVYLLAARREPLSSAESACSGKQTEADDSAEENVESIEGRNENVMKDEAFDAGYAAVEPASTLAEYKDDMILAENECDSEKRIETPVVDQNETNEKEQDTLSEEKSEDSSAYIAAAMNLFHETDDKTIMNEDGHLRASALRDTLLAYQAFRSSLKKSGMQPIAYIQHMFKGRIHIYRNKGIYWAYLSESKSEASSETEERSSQDNKDSVIAQRKRNYYELAFSNMQNRLCDVGLDKAVADEIANIILHSDTAVEPRKVIHTLLCQRFGSKIGAKYYRQTVKYAFTG